MRCLEALRSGPVNGDTLDQEDIESDSIVSAVEKHQPATSWQSHWKLRIDSILAISAGLALIVGILGVVDAIVMMPSFGPKGPRMDADAAVNDNITFKLGPLHAGRVPDSTIIPTFLPLVVFGIATALVWTSSSRATFRVASLEAYAWLVKGVRLDEIPDMLELKKPTKAWWKWRAQMWKSTLFAGFCIACYIALGLTYRRAFTKVQHTVPFSNDSYPRFSLNSSFKPLHTRLNMEPRYMPLTAVPEHSSIDIGSGWSIGFAWYRSSRIEAYWREGGLMGYATAASTFEAKTRGAFLAMVVQNASSNLLDMTGLDFATGIVEHPSCGKNLLACGAGAEGPYCFWMGLTAAQLEVSSSWTSRYVYQKQVFPGTIQKASGIDDCPIALNFSAYERLLTTKGTNDEWQEWSHTINYTRDDFTTLTDLFTLLISYLDDDVNLIHNQTLLRELGLIAPNCPVEECPTYNNTGTSTVTGNHAFSPEYELAASIILVLWATTLLATAYPWRNMVVLGTIEQWMRFGADIENSRARDRTPGNKEDSEVARHDMRLERRQNGEEMVYLDPIEDEKGSSWKRRFKVKF